MNSKERTLLALRSRPEPDRVPVWVTVVAEMADRLAEVTGIPADPLDAYLTNRISHAELLTALGNDVVGIGSTAPPAAPDTRAARRLPGGRMGLCLPPGAAPLWRLLGDRGAAAARASRRRASWPGYRLPDPAAPGRFDVARERACATAGRMPCWASSSARSSRWPGTWWGWSSS